MTVTRNTRMWTEVSPLPPEEHLLGGLCFFHSQGVLVQQKGRKPGEKSVWKLTPITPTLAYFPSPHTCGLLELRLDVGCSTAVRQIKDPHAKCRAHKLSVMWFSSTYYKTWGLKNNEWITLGTKNRVYMCDKCNPARRKKVFTSFERKCHLDLQQMRIYYHL